MRTEINRGFMKTAGVIFTTAGAVLLQYADKIGGEKSGVIYWLGHNWDLAWEIGLPMTVVGVALFVIKK